MRLLLTGIALCSGVLAHSATNTKPGTLEDLVFNPEHLAASLGKKTLFFAPKDQPEVLQLLLATFKQAGLDQKTQLVMLPDSVTPPQALSRAMPRYPLQLRRAGVQGESDFLLFVGADGQVKSLYCYEHNQAELAMAAAAALIRWTYEPVRIGPDQVAVPVLLRQKMLFTIDK